MVGSKGPRKRSGGPTRRGQDETRTSSAGLETVIVSPSSRRRPPTASSAPSRVAGAPRPARLRLVDFSSDWLSTVLALDSVAELPDANALRARALDLKSRFEREAGDAGFTAADIADAVFALVAFLDSAILNNRGAARDVWVTRPMQLELYGHQLAGEQFFERLEALRAERESRIEALEVYACCLAFGFQGRYLLSPEKLPALLEQVQQDVATGRGTGFSPLAPNAGRRKERLQEERQGLAWWVPLAVFVPAVALAWTLVWLTVRLAAGGAASAITKVTSP